MEKGPTQPHLYVRIQGPFLLHEIIHRCVFRHKYFVKISWKFFPEVHDGLCFPSAVAIACGIIVALLLWNVRPLIWFIVVGEVSIPVMAAAFCYVTRDAVQSESRVCTATLVYEDNIVSIPAIRKHGLYRLDAVSPGFKAIYVEGTPAAITAVREIRGKYILYCRPYERGSGKVIPIFLFMR